ncbi:cytidylyltransferase domain-containing protein [Deinococcota bacterium DY0809b]
MNHPAKPRVVAIVQARMGSTRLPGKVMLPLAGKPMIHHVVERVRRVPELDEVVVATSTLEQEQPLVECLHEMGVPVFRGSEQDVLERYYLAAKDFYADAVVRITADCPLISPRVTSAVVRAFLACNGCDYVSNTLKRTFPRGLDTEVVRFSALERAHREAATPSEREHVTPYIWKQPDRFRIQQYRGEVDLSALRWTVDTPEDFKLARRVFEALYPKHPRFDVDEVLSLLKRHPEWTEINAGVRQKGVSE